MCCTDDIIPHISGMASHVSTRKESSQFSFFRGTWVTWTIVNFRVFDPFGVYKVSDNTGQNISVMVDFRRTTSFPDRCYSLWSEYIQFRHKQLQIHIGCVALFPFQIDSIDFRVIVKSWLWFTEALVLFTTMRQVNDFSEDIFLNIVELTLEAKTLSRACQLGFIFLFSRNESRSSCSNQ